MVEDSAAPARVLVTGADGRIGRAVVDALLERGTAVTGLSPQWRRRFPGDRAVTGDATDEHTVATALADVDAVVHLAAIPHPSLGSPIEVYRTNTGATMTVLALAGERGVPRAVIASSINAAGVFMNHHEDVMPAYYPLDEDLPPRLDDGYALSKLSDELTAGMVASRWGTAVVALRFPFVGTAGEARAMGAHAGLQQVREGWSWLELRDAVHAVERSLVAPLTGAVVVGLASAETYMDVETDALLRRHAPGVPLRRPVHGHDGLVDLSRARAVLGFEPRHTVRTEPVEAAR